jgi:proline racemase
MQSSHWINTIDTHTEGQPTRIVTSGVGFLPGNSMAAKRRHFSEHMDQLRTMLLSEPRGHRDMYGCILTQPSVAQADVGVLYMHNSGFMDMCGHATIGLSTALVETGMVSVCKPVTRIVLDTPGGLVTARVTVRGSRAKSVTFQNVPAYVDHLNARLEVGGIGTITVDVAYGGNTFVWYLAEDVGLEISPANIGAIVEVGMKIMEAANDQLPVVDPLTGGPRKINIASALAPTGGGGYQNVHVFGPGQFDRSPGGTGTSSRLAILRAKNQLARKQDIVVTSGITDGVFRGRVLQDVVLGNRIGYVTEITGSAHVTGLHQFLVDPTDRLKEGFLVHELRRPAPDLIPTVLE